MPDLFLKLLPAAAAAISLGITLYLTVRFQRLKQTIDKQEKPEEESPLPSIVAGLKWELTSLADRLATLESEARETPANVTIRSGMNLNKRTQALRQYRLGHASTEIAKSLDMPRAEVDLLLKVHRIVSQ
jgi:hypothetical protein